MHLALIGFGNIGKVHADVLRETFEDVYFVLDYKELLRRNDIDAVSIATPPDSHYAITLDALRAGKHVLVEKPPALNLEHLKELERTAKEQGVVLFTAFHATHRPEVAAARKALQGNIIKEITITYKEFVLNYHDANGWIFDPHIAGGGVLMDSGINALSVLYSILPDLPKLRIDSVMLKKAQNFRVETSANVTFSVERQGSGILDMDWMYQGPEVRQIVFRTESDEYIVDIVQSNFLKNGVVVEGKTQQGREMVDQYLEYRGVYVDFAAHVAAGTSSVRTAELRFVLDTYRKGNRSF
ncbi:MAG: hypothetical protein UY27_C0007G0057 [Candidatus Gottesmanbacteria bacterium GW2011_GWA1_48_13]|uniref:Gfo/Idh/MocA-like oxidoreductase N-terminal domain-containing protein n=1 Tax=Candidatus Gottesmanbacteria bacterium GW2011_GWA1_48_13 TaxID=1618439 RepID=A0A0G1UP23_9BACT|nr:MAG: hypothetical protein UY27_C0007G0057 [Candidatus Gottesmanbacteria bacterium GW2011_GWA1_48_13]